MTINKRNHDEKINKIPMTKKNRKEGNGDATKKKCEKRNIYLSMKLTKMIHNQGCHKENPLHVCLFFLK
jgi:flagellar hook protein FlgE